MYVTIKIGNETFSSLIDTGASGIAFISESLCKRLSLATEVLKSAVVLIGFEGTSGSKISTKVNVPLKIGNHSEILSAFVVPNSKYDLVLGLPWLEKHSPFIDWKEHTLTFGESCMKSSCCNFETTIPYHNSPVLKVNEDKPDKPKSSVTRPK